MGAEVTLKMGMALALAVLVACTAGGDRTLTGDVVCAIDPTTGTAYSFYSGSLVPDGWELCRDGLRECLEACDPEDIARDRAGPDAVACGRVPRGADSTAAVQCALDAEAAGQAFWVLLERTGRDTTQRRAFVGTASGDLLLLEVDISGCTTPTCSGPLTEDSCGTGLQMTTSSTPLDPGPGLYCGASGNPTPVCEPIPPA
jgi:hypothetical protein